VVAARASFGWRLWRYHDRNSVRASFVRSFGIVTISDPLRVQNSALRLDSSVGGTSAG
jgi:hypothetical protein